MPRPDHSSKKPGSSLLPRWNAAERSFADYGLYENAYVKPVVLKGRAMVAVHAADGRLLNHFANVELAFAILRQEDFEPLRVH